MLAAFGASAPSDYMDRLLSTLEETAKRSGYDPHIRILPSGEAVVFNADGDEIFFIDVELPGLDGLETARRLRDMQLNSEIVFLAGDLGRVLAAFDVDALHYIIYDETPQEKVAEICERAIARTVKRRRKLLKLNCAGEYRVLDIGQIRYFEVFDHILRVHYNDTYFECYSTLSKMEDALNGMGFIRTHKSYYVALRYVQSIVSKEIAMQDGSRLPISRNRYAEVKAAWLDLIERHDAGKGGGDD